ncbi:MAG: aminomethyl-transferring glycine dehydrogenase subunit GcvPA [Parachlamydiaceae bacterium]
MDYAANQKEQIDKQLKFLGIESIEKLFEAVPRSLLQKAPKEDDGLSEMEAFQKIVSIGKKNKFPEYKNYLGGGSYEHYVPAIVSFIAQNSAFLTSYTPYQAEAAQGYLQAMFEYQSAITTLTQMDVAIGSVYDGASASSEAVLMALRVHPNRRKVIFASTINPRYQGVIDQYIKGLGIESVFIPAKDDKSLDFDALKTAIDSNTAAIVVQSPNYLGLIEDVKQVSEIKRDALLIMIANPMSFGLYAAPGELGVDISVGDTQPFGIPLQFGGPYAGYMAAKSAYVRQLPGRIVGETTDSKGERGFVLVLQTREQHIRREKATSNICTNQALMSLSTLVSLLWYGKEGLPKLAKLNYERAMYLKTGLEKMGFKTIPGPIFNEFWVGISNLKPFKEKKIAPGIVHQNGLIVAVTETKTLEDLDLYLNAAKESL